MQATSLDEGFAALETERKTGSEQFEGSGAPLDLKLADFWSWSASDLVSNATRGVLAEYIVASALGLTAGNKVRAQWDAFDLLFGRTKIEVKSAAYLQSWYHKKLSPLISFGIQPTRSWDASTSELATEMKRR